MMNAEEDSSLFKEHSINSNCIKLKKTRDEKKLINSKTSTLTHQKGGIQWSDRLSMIQPLEASVSAETLLN